MYTQAFKEVVVYCKANNLFVGYGNPNGKVLIIGKVFRVEYTQESHQPKDE